MNKSPFLSWSEYGHAGVMVLGAAAAAGLGENWAPGAIVGGGIGGILNYLTNRISSRHEKIDSSAPPSHQETGANGHLYRLGGEVIAALLGRAAERAQAAIPPEAPQKIAALHFASARAGEYWVRLLELPARTRLVEPAGAERATAADFQGLDGQELTRAIAEFTAAPDLAHVLNPALWSCFFRFVFTGREAPPIPTGLSHEMGVLLHEKFAGEFYERAKHAASYDPVTFAAIQLHFLGCLRNQTEASNQKLDAAIALLEARTAVVGQFSANQLSALADSLLALGSDLKTLGAEVRGIPEEIVAQIAGAQLEKLNQVAMETTATRVAAERGVAISEEMLRQMRQLSIAVAERLDQHENEFRPAPQQPAGLAPRRAPDFALFAADLSRSSGRKITGREIELLVAAEFARQDRELDAQRFALQVSVESMKKRLRFAWRAFSLSRGPGADANVQRSIELTESILVDLQKVAPPPANLERDVRLLRIDLFARAARWAEAIVEAERARELAEETDSALWASAQWKLAEILVSSGQPIQSIPEWATLLGYLKRDPRKHREPIVLVLHRLADAKGSAGELSEATRVAADALRLGEEAFGSKHTTVGMLSGNLGYFLGEQGRNEEAEPLLRRALAIYEGALGRDHPSVGAACCNLAQFLGSQGPYHYEEAEALFRRARAIHEKQPEVDHGEVASDCAKLGVLFIEQGRNEEAEPLLRQALELEERVRGRDHPEVGTACCNLGIVCGKRGQPEEAEALLRRALAIHEKKLGRDHLRVGTDCAKLAAFLSTQGRLAEMEPLLRRALDLEAKARGQDHPDVVTGCLNLGMLLQNQGNYDEAGPLLRRALHFFHDTLGAAHAKTFLAAWHLCDAAFGPAEQEEAGRILIEDVAVLQARENADSQFLAETQMRLAEWHQRNSRLAEARDMGESALATQLNVFGEQHPRTQAMREWITTLSAEASVP